MLCKCHWIVLYIVHFTAFCLGGPFFSGHGVFKYSFKLQLFADYIAVNLSNSIHCSLPLSLPVHDNWCCICWPYMFTAAVNSPYSM